MRSASRLVRFEDRLQVRIGIQRTEVGGKNEHVASTSWDRIQTSELLPARVAVTGGRYRWPLPVAATGDRYRWPLPVAATGGRYR
jgi:hypothetical protein